MDLKKVLLLILLLLCFLPGKAQIDASFSNYFALNGYYNPAYAGQFDRLNIYGTYSMQMVGFTNAPKTMYFGADMPFKFLEKRHGVGVGFFNETIGLFSNQRFWAQYSYKMDLWGGKLGFGLQLGAVNISFDPSDIEFYSSDGGDGEGGTDMDDPAFPGAIENGMGLDLGMGIYYTHPLFYAGLSAAHITAPTVGIGDTNEIKIDPMFYFTGGCNIKTKNPLISIQPSAIVMTDMANFKAILTGRMFYTLNDKTFYGGLSYSPTISVGFLFGAKLKDIDIGYGYEMFTSKIGTLNGSHDIYVTYSLDLNFMAKSKNKHKSIRIL